MIIFYYTIYLTDGTIHLKPFESREEAKEYGKGADEYWKSKGRYKYSKVTRKDLSCYPEGHWL